MPKVGVKLKTEDFVHLHNHTEFSLLDGLTKTPSLIEEIKNLGMDSVAITDHGTLSGAIDFYKAAKDAYVKPIVGMEAYVAPRKHTLKDPGYDRQYFHLTMLAMNNEGYHNLMRLSTIANLKGFYYRPRIDKQLIEEFSGGIIILSGCIQSEVSDALRQGQYTEAKKIAQWYKKIFGERYFLEVHDHGHTEHPSVWEEQKRVNDGLLELSKELNLPAVVTCDAHYLKREDKEAHEVLLCVQTGAFLEDSDRMSLNEFELHVTDPKEIIKRWAGTHPELISNTKKIADMCQIEIELDKILIPKFPVPKGKTEKSLLNELVWQGLTLRYAGENRESIAKMSIDKQKKSLPQEIVDRANYELGIVDSMGFNGYFLIVADFINWGERKGHSLWPWAGECC